MFYIIYNTTIIIIIRFVFCDIQNNQGISKGYQLQPWALADNPYLNLDYSGYQKPHLIIILIINPFVTQCKIKFTFFRQHRIAWSFHVADLQRTAKKCTKSCNALAQLLYCSLNLLFSDVPVAVAITLILNSLVLVTVFA